MINKRLNNHIRGHRIISVMILCLFGFCLMQAMQAPKKHARKRPHGDRVYLLHADELYYDMFGNNPDAQILKGKVSFLHQGSHLTCDSAYFYQASNSVKAFGHVHYRQGDTLSLTCNRAEYDGQMQMMRARKNVVLHHRRQTLRTDSLDFDRLYNMANFFDGGTLIDGKDKLVADWGEYHTETREAKFVYNVKLRSGKDVVTTDTLYYDVRKSKAHMVGPSKIVSGASVVKTTDSVYRKVHAYPKVRAYRLDMQAICDSLVFNSQDSCMTMYKDPIVWNGNRQLLGEKILVFMNDSTVRFAHVIGQALSVEQMPDSVHFNQISSSEMKSYFEKGEIKQGESIGNVQTIYYMTDDKDSSLIGLNYLETDTMRMYMGPGRKMEKIWTNKFTSTMYPMTQIPPAKYKLNNFAWFEDLRPKDKNDIFVWRGKSKGSELKNIKRHEAPLQKLTD